MPLLIAPPSLHSFLFTAILVVASVAVVTDLRERRISNRLTFPAMAIGLVANAALAGFRGLLLALAGFALAAALFLIPVAMGGMGAGDLKLVAALGALGGPGFAFWCVVLASIAGGVFALAALVSRRQLTAVVGGTMLDLYTRQPLRATSGIRLPFAVPIAVGALSTLLIATLA